jgi:hypothetical protein
MILDFDLPYFYFYILLYFFYHINKLTLFFNKNDKDSFFKTNL